MTNLGSLEPMKVFKCMSVTSLRNSSRHSNLKCKAKVFALSPSSLLFLFIKHLFHLSVINMNIYEKHAINVWCLILLHIQLKWINELGDPPLHRNVRYFSAWIFSSSSKLWSTPPCDNFRWEKYFKEEMPRIIKRKQKKKFDKGKQL